VKNIFLKNKNKYYFDIFLSKIHFKKIIITKLQNTPSVFFGGFS
jgi:hypothetical protein